jgi:hypothetical protein
MAFTTQRGRPRTTAPATDCGTPELRMKHALGLTAEPIDLCLEKKLITADHHWCGLHLRWLYTLRYGAPSLTTRYSDDNGMDTPTTQDPTWRAMRESEYHEARQLLMNQRYYEPVMRLAIFNELPAFLSPTLQARAWNEPKLVHMLTEQRCQLRAGLELLTQHWRRRPARADAQMIQTADNYSANL